MVLLIHQKKIYPENRLEAYWFHWLLAIAPIIDWLLVFTPIVGWMIAVKTIIGFYDSISEI